MFDKLAFGWQNYQPAAGTGFVTWIDDIALTKERIGGAKQIKQDEPMKLAPTFATAATVPKVAKLKESITAGRVGAGVNALTKLGDDKDAKTAEAAKAALAEIQAWKEANDMEIARLKDAGDIYTAAELVSGMASGYSGNEAAKAYQEQLSALKKDPGYAAGKEFQKIAETPADQLKDPHFVSMVKSFVKRHPSGYYFDLAQPLLPDK